MAASGTGTIVHRIGGAVGINVASFGNPNFGTNYLLSLTGPNVTVTSGTVNWCSLSPLGLADGGATSSTVARTLYVNPTINYTAASKTGNYEALTINAVETSLPTGTNYLLRLQAGASGGVDKAAFDNTGSLKFATIDASSATNTPVVKLNLTSPAIGNPTGTTSTTRVMMGMGSSVTLTPRSSGRVFVVATAVGRNNTSSDGVQIEIRYGTGVAPANGAALTGSSIGNFVNWSPGTGTPDTSMTVSGVAVGLSVGTAYWFDFGLAAIIGGTGSVVNVSYTVIEL